MINIFSLDFLNRLERNVPIIYRHLVTLFQTESEARFRVINRGPIDENDFRQLNEHYEDLSTIYNAQLEQVFVFQWYAPLI